MTRILAGVIAVLLIATLWLWGSKNTVQGQRDAALTATAAIGAELKATQGALEDERQSAQRLQAIATKYEGDRNEIERQAASDVAALRDGNLRLRQQWQGCQSRLPGADPASSQPDADAGLREQGAVDLVRYAAQCDAQVRGLQAVITADRTPAEN